MRAASRVSNASNVISAELDHNKGGKFTFDDGYLQRLRSGDEETAQHFAVYFRRVLKIKLWARFGRDRQDDLIDEIMAIALENIFKGQLRDAACLPGYVRAICANIARRPDSSSQTVELDLDRISARSLSAEQNLLAEERANLVRNVLRTLAIRDRNILVDLFYNDLKREEVCAKYGVTRDQLRLLLFRARGRFQEKWAKRD